MRARRSGPPRRRGEAGDLLDIGGGVAADARGVAAIDLVDLRRGSARSGPARPGDGRRLRSVAGEIAGGEIVSGEHASRVSINRGGGDSGTRRWVEIAGGARRAARWRVGGSVRAGEGHAEAAGAGVEEGEVEAVEVVVLDDVGVGGLNARDEAADEVGFGGRVVAGGFEDFGCAGGVADGDEEDAVAVGIEAGGFEVELEAAEVVEGEVAKVVAAGGDEVLFFGREGEDGLLAELAQGRDAAAEALGCGLQDCGGEGLQIGCADEESKGAGALKFAPGGELGIEVPDIIEEEPGTESGFLADEFAGAARPPPDSGAPVRLGPHRYDSRGRVPSPQPLVFAGTRRGVSHVRTP